jgi:DNA-binding NarL/FixJ family response regulator
MSETYRIHIVDDHQFVLDGIKSMLKGSKKYQINGESLCGETAYDFIEKNHESIDWVLTDISMKEMSGLDLCSNIKNEFPKMKVIMLSMHDDVKTIKEAIAADADGYILKSSGKQDFLNGLNTFAERGSFYSYEIIPLIFADVQNKKSPQTENKLTQREMEVLKLIIEENTSREIAEKLFISKQTVDTHRMNIMEKTEARSVVGLIKYAIQTGIVCL